MQHPGTECHQIYHTSQQTWHQQPYSCSAYNFPGHQQPLHLTTSLATSINFNQMILHLRSVFANLQDSLHYLQTVSTHTMEYIDATTSSILSPHVLPITDLQRML